MTLFLYISQNIDRIKYEVKIGLISCALLNHWQIYSRYDYYRKTENPVSYSVAYVCSDFNVNRDFVYKIIKKMETEI